MSTEDRLLRMETRINGISHVTVEAVIFILRIVDAASCPGIAKGVPLSPK